MLSTGRSIPVLVKIAQNFNGKTGLLFLISVQEGKERHVDNLPLSKLYKAAQFSEIDSVILPTLQRPSDRNKAYFPSKETHHT